MLCTNCGRSMQEGVAFCANCGAPAPGAVETDASQTTEVNGATSGSGSEATPPPPTLKQASPPQPPPAQMPPTQPPPPPAGFGQAPPQGPPPGYNPGWRPPQGPGGGGNRTGLIVGAVAAAIIILAGLGVGLYFGLRGDDSDKTVTSKTTVASSSTSSTGSTSTSTTSTTEAAFVQEEGEIFLEAAGKAGPEPFTGETFVPAGPPSTLNIPTSSTVLTTTTTTTIGPGTTVTATGPTTATTSAAVQVASVVGDAPALYGGSKDKSLVDKEGQLRFFEQNPEKAAAFCAALNADPTFEWSGGKQIQPSQLREYFDELTPMMLTRDTRVTNHGFRNGQPTPRQAVLQKGQMVLVDRYGIPRVRCECGNPLAPPKPVQKTPKYTGPKWPDFDPTTIIVVQPTTVIIDIFVVVDIHTGQPFDRPWGTEGTDDMDHTMVWQLDVAMDYTDDDAHVFTVEWSGAVTRDPIDGSLSGEGAGMWYVDGPYYEGDEVIGQMTANGFYYVDFSGQADTTEFGDILVIVPVMSSFTIDDQFWDGPDPEGAKPDFENIIEDIIAMSFDMVLELAATNREPVYAEVGADPWYGGATLAPYVP